MTHAKYESSGVIGAALGAAKKIDLKRPTEEVFLRNGQKAVRQKATD